MKFNSQFHLKAQRTTTETETALLCNSVVKTLPELTNNDGRQQQNVIIIMQN